MEPAADVVLTEAEYLALDEGSDVRHEFYGGEVVAMAGADPRHGAVAASLVRQLGARLEGGPCLVWAADQRVRVDETGLYAYPDLVVVCGRPEFADTRPRTLLNPLVVIEVLSSSTESLDRGAKFAHFQRRSSLAEYVLVSPAERRVEHYRRLEGDRWELTVVAGDGVLAFPALGPEVPLDQVYEQADRLAELTA